MTDPTREAFEAWAVANCPGNLHRDVDGEYSHANTHAAWLAWQAALSARAQGEASTLHDRIEFALRDAGISESEAARITAIATTPAARAVDVDDAMVERAWKAATLACVVNGKYRSPISPDEWFSALRPALLAALAARAQGEAVAFVNHGDSEANFIADADRLNCPACGGSGHVDDITPAVRAVDDAMVGEIVEVDFEANTITFRMELGYVVAAGKYTIAALTQPEAE